MFTMQPTLSFSKQKALPSLRELLPAAILFPTTFVIGFSGIIIGSNAYFAPPVSHGVLWLGLLLCLISGGIILRSFRTWKLANELDNEGLVVRGTILALWEDTHDSVNFIGHTPKYYLLYTFDLDTHETSPQQFAANQYVSYQIYQQLQVGNQARVRFLPRNPNISRMETPAWKWEY